MLGLLFQWLQHFSIFCYFKITLPLPLQLTKLSLAHHLYLQALHLDTKTMVNA